VGLVHDGGQITYLDSSWLLVSAVRTAYVLPSTNITQIEKIRFSVGVGADVNHNDPNAWPSGHPLAIQQPGMHWGWAAGYKFVVFEGEADDNNDGVPNEIWQIHPTGDQFLRNVEVPVTPVINGNDIELFLDYDLREWVRGINLATAGIDHSDGPASLALMDNIVTYQVFRSSGTTSNDEVQPVQGASLYFNHIEAERPIVHFEGDAAKGEVHLQVVDMGGRLVYQSPAQPVQGKARVEARLAKGIYTCNLVQQGQITISKKFQVF